jgi:hypothetical protein
LQAGANSAMVPAKVVSQRAKVVFMVSLLKKIIHECSVWSMQQYARYGTGKPV